MGRYFRRESNGPGNCPRVKIVANCTYTVDQEGVAVDEKETDIRLRATTSDHQAVIDLKLGDGRTGRDLRGTIKRLLVNKYMAPDACRSGCLLVTISKNRTWKHSETKKCFRPRHQRSLTKWDWRCFSQRKYWIYCHALRLKTSH